MTDNLAVDNLSVDTSEMAQYTMEAELYLKQLANKTRLMVLCSLVDKELSVTQMLDQVDVSQPGISQHLALLRESKMVATRRDGQTIYYRLADERVKQTIGLLHKFFCAQND